MNINSHEVIAELKAILQANTLLELVDDIGKATALAQETHNTAAYINLTNAVPNLKRNSPEVDGYDFHGFFSIVVNTNCATDTYLIYDVVDSVMRSVLNDNDIWGKLVNRDIISIEYDNAELWTKRSAILTIEVVYQLTCTA